MRDREYSFDQFKRTFRSILSGNRFNPTNIDKETTPLTSIQLRNVPDAPNRPPFERAKLPQRHETTDGLDLKKGT
jgi:hypothetical protein